MVAELVIDVASMPELEGIVAFLAQWGQTTTSLVFSTPIDHCVLGAPSEAPGEGFGGPRRLAG